MLLFTKYGPFRGRLGFRQYCLGKAHKYGIIVKTVWPTTYTNDIIIYSGKQEERQTDLAGTVVMKLMHKYVDAGLTLCTDNFHTNDTLAAKLLEWVSSTECHLYVASLEQIFLWNYR